MTINGENARFFVIGDWGGMRWLPYKTIVQERVALSMAANAQKLQTHFQIGTGDNFYAFGVRNSLDKRFQVSYQMRFKRC